MSTAFTQDVVIRLTALVSCSRRPTPIQPDLIVPSPALAPSTRTSVGSGNIDPPTAVTRLSAPSIRSRRYVELFVTTVMRVPGSRSFSVTPFSQPDSNISATSVVQRGKALASKSEAESAHFGG